MLIEHIFYTKIPLETANVSGSSVKEVVAYESLRTVIFADSFPNAYRYRTNAHEITFLEIKVKADLW